MKYTVDGWNNFCRVFELPERFSSNFCFGGGIPTNFSMVDWFNPIPDVGQPTVSKEVWRERVGEIPVKKITHEELFSFLVPWLRQKAYIKPHRKYLIICDFGACFMFENSLAGK